MPPAPKTDFLQELNDEKPKDSYSRSLFDTVEVWSDYKSVYLQPHSLVELSTHTHNDKLNKFGTYTRGREVYEELGMQNELLDERVRRFMEESDCAQGFQVFCDVDDGFSGFSAATLTALAEDYPKKGLFVFGVRGPVPNDESPVISANLGCSKCT